MSQLTMDHVLIGIRDLDQTPHGLGEILGFKVTPEGVHPGRGTHNRLVVFQKDYLELLSINDPSADLYRPNLADFLKSREGLFIFAMGTDNVDQWYSDLKSRGVVVKEPVDGARTSEDGSSAYTWRQSEIDIAETPGSQTFLIQHHQMICERYSQPPNPTNHANGVVGIGGLVLAVHDAKKSAFEWQKLFDLDSKVVENDSSGSTYRVRLDLDGCDLDFVSPLETGTLSSFLEHNGQVPYMLSLRVKSLTETIALLKRQRVVMRQENTGTNRVSVLIDGAYAHGIFLEFVQDTHGKYPSV